MVARDRFGGLFSVLNKRDLASIDAMEVGLVDDPPAGSTPMENQDEAWLDEDLNFSAVAADYSLQEIADHLEYARYYLSSVMSWNIGEDTYSFTQEARIGYGEAAGRVRRYIATIDKVLAKVKRAIRKLDTEALD